VADCITQTLSLTACSAQHGHKASSPVHQWNTHIKAAVYNAINVDVLWYIPSCGQLTLLGYKGNEN